ncbi:MAG: isochorismatase family protein [Bacteroidales bacterium]|jgi:nicotinamidase-related amidase
MNLNSNSVIHLVVDMLYDFIDGTLACRNAIPAVEKSIQYINRNPLQKVVYICDNHPADHCSFISNGGTWPPHCVTGSRGQFIHEDFYSKIVKESSRPCPGNTFSKGQCRTEEQYSGIEAVNTSGEFISEFLKRVSPTKGECIVVISGIATEFCVMESTLDLLRAGYKVYIVTEGLAYVDDQGHTDTLNILKEKGATLI